MIDGPSLGFGVELVLIFIYGVLELTKTSGSLEGKKCRVMWFTLMLSSKSNRLQQANPSSHM